MMNHCSKCHWFHIFSPNVSLLCQPFGWEQTMGFAHSPNSIKWIIENPMKINTDDRPNNKQIYVNKCVTAANNNKMWLIKTIKCESRLVKDNNTTISSVWFEKGKTRMETKLILIKFEVLLYENEVRSSSLSPSSSMSSLLLLLWAHVQQSNEKLPMKFRQRNFWLLFICLFYI